MDLDASKYCCCYSLYLSCGETCRGEDWRGGGDAKSLQGHATFYLYLFTLVRFRVDYDSGKDKNADCIGT
jgi:hypothetical protein